MEQKILRMEFETKLDILVPRFFPLVNSSQLKIRKQEIDEITKEKLAELDSREARAEEIARMFQEEEGKFFSSLEELNNLGWQLQFTDVMLDDLKLGYQIAIFVKQDQDDI